MSNVKENMIVYRDKELASIAVSTFICNEIKEVRLDGKNPVLGLATGTTTEKIYEYLVENYKQGMTFNDVTCFNLDEYYPIRKTDQNSFYYFMFNRFFNHVDIRNEQINIPDGDVAMSEVKKFCNDYERKINEAGGIDIQVLGIGENGHIAFNEPGSEQDSITRLVELDDITRKNAAHAFGSINAVPKLAITMGISTILKAKKIILLAFGENKSAIVKKLLSEPIGDVLPASFLKLHHNYKIVVDQACACKL